jgi:hypothetical protein
VGGDWSSPEAMSSGGLPHPAAVAPRQRELYIDVFRGLMALVMVQGHVMDALLTAAAQNEPLYVFQRIFHGSTAPGFLFASGFVAGLPRAPLSLRASLRRARRLLFVLGVGYYLHLPYSSLWKTIASSSDAERHQLLGCDALQVIAVTQLLVLVLQWLVGPSWTRVAAGLALVVVAATPTVWSWGLSSRLPEWLGAYFDQGTGSHFPVFPFSAFVLGGTLAGATLGRASPEVRFRREIVWGLSLAALGLVLAGLLQGRVDFWGPSPAYACLRLGGLFLLLLLVEAACRAALPGVRALALFGHETLLVYVLHLHMLYSGPLGVFSLLPRHGQLDFEGASLVLLLMFPVLLGAAWIWRSVKQRAPHEAQLLLVFVSVAFVYEFLVRPW